MKFREDNALGDLAKNVYKDPCFPKHADTKGEILVHLVNEQLDNLTVADGDFGVICPFLDQGQHQVILSVRSENYALALASFNMTIP
jgi:hypothetical protein